MRSGMASPSSVAGANSHLRSVLIASSSSAAAQVSQDQDIRHPAALRHHKRQQDLALNSLTPGFCRVLGDGSELGSGMVERGSRIRGGIRRPAVSAKLNPHLRARSHRFSVQVAGANVARCTDSNAAASNGLGCVFSSCADLSSPSFPITTLITHVCRVCTRLASLG